jgi:hypothetical protein
VRWVVTQSSPNRGRTICKPARTKNNNYKMNRVPHQPEDSPNLVSTGPGTLERLLNHLDPGPAEESEAFVRLIYEQRRSVLSFMSVAEIRGGALNAN